MAKNRIMAPIGLLSAAIALNTAACSDNKETRRYDMPDSIYGFTMKSIDGKMVPLSEYSGKVILLVNVASRCGFTPQYAGLEKVYLKYKDKGFVILGFPSNDFMGQEPGTDAEIRQFCSLNYGVTFPMFSKIKVKGDGQDPLYQFLTGKKTDPDFSGDIKWNFNKFLIDRSGKIVNRFDSPDAPDGDKVTTSIEKLL